MILKPKNLALFKVLKQNILKVMKKIPKKNKIIRKLLKEKKLLWLLEFIKSSVKKWNYTILYFKIYLLLKKKNLS